MAFDTVMEAPHGGNLVGHAVHRNRFLSIEGVLERFSALLSEALYTRKSGKIPLWIWPPWRSSLTTTLSPLPRGVVMF